MFIPFHSYMYNRCACVYMHVCKCVLSVLFRCLLFLPLLSLNCPHDKSQMTSKKTFIYLMFYSGVPGFATDCPCGVWCRGLSTCFLSVGPLFGNLVWNDSGYVSFTEWKTTVSLFSTTYHIYLNDSQHDNTFFSFTLFSRLKFYFLFYIAL